MHFQPSKLVERIQPSNGVITLFGYGISARVDRGHLILEENIGPRRRQAILPRVGHGLKRLTVIGAEGCISLGALRWLADQGAALTLLERDGSVLAVAGPVGPCDARLRRSQSLAHQSGLAVEVNFTKARWARTSDSRLFGRHRHCRLDSHCAKVFA